MVPGSDACRYFPFCQSSCYMIVFPNCKINLGLQVQGKRADGYHNLSTVFYPLPWYDVLEIIRLPAANKSTSTTQQQEQLQIHQLDDLVLVQSGLSVAGDPATNLCVKAYRLLQTITQLPPVWMHLHKNIPMGAGLGGGSADGAFTLQLLNQQFQLGLSQQQLMELALQLGSDCPFFIHNQPCHATGRGEILEPLQLDLGQFHWVLVNPGIHVNTGWAFAQLNTSAEPASQPTELRTIVQLPVTSWKNQLKNDFEVPVAAAHPEIAACINQLYNAGATYAAMTGSGSTVFGLFEQAIQPQLHFPQHYLVKKLASLSQ